MTDGWFYTAEQGARGQTRLFATELTRGPWSNEHQHGGPPAALLARALEQLEPSLFFARISIELLRPIPIAAPLEVVTEVLTAGRTVRRFAAALVSGDQQLAVAVAVGIRVTELGLPARLPSQDELLAPLDQATPFEFSFFQHQVGYHTAVEVRVVGGEWGTGRMSAWMRPRVALVEGEDSSPLQRVMICADAGHGLGSALDPSEWSFVNPDLTVQLHRLPSTAWLGMDARTWTEPLGFGACRTRLCDHRGDLGVVLQSQVVSKIG